MVVPRLERERDRCRGKGYDGERQWDGATWSVLLPSLLHYPHAYPIAAAPYIMVLLVDTKKLEQQHGELSECICHICVSQSCTPSSLPHEEYFWVAGYTRPLVFVRSLWPEGQTLERYLSIYCPWNPESTDGPRITPTTTSAYEDVKIYVKICVARSPTADHPMWRRPQ